jgi:hypothetical protein
MKKFIVLLVLLLPLAVLGQSTVNYSYSDPCTGKVKNLTFLDNQTITVNYLGYIQAFDFNQINNGDLETWINGVARQNTSSPCEATTTVVTKESDWKTYYGSAKPILELIKLGKQKDFDRKILRKYLKYMFKFLIFLI